jgi:hypothetical protein
MLKTDLSTYVSASQSKNNKKHKAEDDIFEQHTSKKTKSDIVKNYSSDVNHTSPVGLSVATTQPKADFQAEAGHV